MFQAEDGIRDLVRSRGLGDVYKRQVLVCVSGAPSSYEFRNAVREFAYNAGCKVGHMPGIDQATLLLADVNYEELIQHCELLATALLQSNSLTIKTTLSLIHI